MEKSTVPLIPLPLPAAEEKRDVDSDDDEWDFSPYRIVIVADSNEMNDAATLMNNFLFKVYIYNNVRGHEPIEIQEVLGVQAFDDFKNQVDRWKRDNEWPGSIDGNNIKYLLYRECNLTYSEFENKYQNFVKLAKELRNVFRPYHQQQRMELLRWKKFTGPKKRGYEYAILVPQKLPFERGACAGVVRTQRR